jgi:multiple sugar transport system permease protein
VAATISKPYQRFRYASLLKHILLIVGAIIMTYPLLWMLSSSFKVETKIFTDLGLIPNPFILDNYPNGWNALGLPFTRFYVNSFIISGLAVIGTVFSCAMAAYAFARLDFKFKRVWFTLMLGTIMLPYHVTLIPRYIMFFQLGWVNTILPLTVPHFLAVDAFFVFLIVQFIRGLPRDLDDAASIDGANEWQIFTNIIMPLAAPALVTTAIFTFIWSWDNFFSHLLYLSKVSLYTVPLGLRAFIDSQDRSSFGPLFAMSILSLVPIFVIFITLQQQLVEGVSKTGLKG